MVLVTMIDVGMTTVVSSVWNMTSLSIIVVSITSTDVVMGLIIIVVGVGSIIGGRMKRQISVLGYHAVFDSGS